MSDEQKPKEVKPIIIKFDPVLYRAFVEVTIKGLEAIKDEDEDKNDEDA